MQQSKTKRTNKILYCIVSLLHCIIIISCAQIIAPTGGEKDKIAPKIIRESPPNKSINFNQSTIKIKFDEWMSPLTNPKNQIIISPNIEPFPKIEVLKNNLTLEIKSAALQPNTTYSIFFGDNLKDNNENNPLSNYKYLFSTGNYLDSLMIKGKINAIDGKIPDNTFLLFYKENDDSAFLSKKPFYISKINTDGSVNIENVKNGSYKIYALTDKNGNYFYDLPTELIGFDTTYHDIQSNIDTLNFPLFLPEENKLRIAEYDRTIKNGILSITLNKELSYIKDDITICFKKDTAIQAITFIENDQKKLKVYFPSLKDSTKQTLLIKNNNELIDSIQVNFEKNKSKATFLLFSDTTELKNITAIETQSFSLNGSGYCIAPTDTAKIILMDSSQHKLPFSISRDKDLRTYHIKADWKAGNKYKIICNDSAFTDISQNYSKKQEFSFTATSIKKTGNLLITYELPQKNTNYIVLLADIQGKVWNKQILNDSQPLKIDYGWLLAGNYSIQVIEDLNNDGIRNSGSFYKKSLPERLYKHVKPILIKENWDAEETVKIDFSIPSTSVTPPPNKEKSIEIEKPNRPPPNFINKSPKKE